MSKCILIQANYKCWESGSVLHEAWRELDRYKNYVDFDKSHLNLHSIYEFNKDLTFPDFIKKYKDDHNIKGRFNIDKNKNKNNGTNVMCQSLFSASSDFFKDKSRDEILDYFYTCIDWFKQKNPACPILSIDIHFDESNPHMHLSWMPIYIDENQKKSFNLSKLQSGKDYFSKMQSEFLSFLRDKGYSFEDFGTDKEYLDLPDFKSKMDELEVLNKTIDERKELVKTENIEFDGRSNLFNRDEIIVSKEEYQKVKEISLLIDELKNENVVLQNNVIELQSENERLSKYHKLYIDLKIQFEKMKKVYDKVFDFLKHNKMYDSFWHSYEQSIQQKRTR